MKCPVDNATLLITDRSGIEIDYCPECRGVWLDRGELDKLVQGSASYEENRRESRDDRNHEDRRHDYDDDDRDRGYDRRDSHHSGGHHKKKEGFLGDLFDF
jgi:Zn-finger nucleic acid-binding protein